MTSLRYLSFPTGRILFSRKWLIVVCVQFMNRRMIRTCFERLSQNSLSISHTYPFDPRYFDWWKNDRDVDGNGLVTILHPWESGIDLSPAYDPALGVADKNRARPTWKQAYSPLIKLVLQYNFLHGIPLVPAV